MFNALFEDDTGGANKGVEDAAKENAEEASTSSATNPLLNFWTVATAVTNTVKARADELVKSVVDTDWRSELSQFGREVGEESKTLKEKTTELVEHLPEQVVHLPEKAEEALHHLPGQVHLPKDVGQTLEGVGVAFAQLGKTLLQGTKELIDELKEGVETEIAAASREGKRAARNKSAGASAAKLSGVTAKYNRFEAEVAAMQRDSSTYCDEPEDAEEYARWRSEFSLESVRADIGRILAENAFMAELQSRLVPIIVDHEDFWHRYFYRLHKLQQKEEQRQQLAQRAKTLQEDDVPLGWGDEDEVQPSPRVAEGASTPSGTSAAAGAEPAAAAFATESEPKPAEPAGASSPKEPSPPVLRPAGVMDPRAGQAKGGVAAAAIAAAAATVATVSSSEVESTLASSSPAAAESTLASSSPAAAESTLASSSPAAAEPAGGGGKAQSGGGASTAGSAGLSVGTSVHVEGEGGQLESEPHAETASDSSAKEWCMVSSDAKPDAFQPGAVAPLETAAAAEASVRQSDSSASPPPVSPTVGGDEAGPASGSPVAAAREFAAAERPGAAAAEVLEAPDRQPEAAPVAKPAVKGRGDAGEEELDEDWGNWD